MKSKFALALLASVAVIAAAATDALAAGRGGGGGGGRGGGGGEYHGGGGGGFHMGGGGMRMGGGGFHPGGGFTRPRLMAAASGWAVARQASMASTRAVPTDSPDATLALAAFRTDNDAPPLGGAGHGFAGQPGARTLGHQNANRILTGRAGAVGAGAALGAAATHAHFAHNLTHAQFAHNQFAAQNFRGLQNFSHTGFNRNAFGDPGH